MSEPNENATDQKDAVELTQSAPESVSQLPEEENVISPSRWGAVVANVCNVEAFRSYTTIKEVIIFDRRLALLLWFFRILILVFIIVELLVRHRYARFEPTTGTVNAWTRFNDNITLAQVPLVDNSAPYCNNPNYNVEYSDTTSGFVAENISCAYFYVGEIVEFTNDEVRVICFTQRLNLSDLSYQNIFVRDAENTLISFQHSFATSWTSGTNINTRFHRPDGKVVKVVPAGYPIEDISVNELLSYAGTSLDLTISQVGGIWDIYQRVTGVILIVRLEFTNYREGSFERSTRCDITVSHQVGLWGYLGSSILEGDTRNTLVLHNSVRIKFVIAGELGRFEFTNLILSLVSSVVLLKVAQDCVDLTGKLILTGTHKAGFDRAKTDHIDDLGRRTKDA